ncbi:hypothetical protein ABT247_17535 [Kitasatospora sp. NPDC001539]|uniref:hypothetical protein n=1 Tax=Kitasatospora sp. NPDC001539 TaxID=3154384 RepID=UPI00332093C8
MTAQLAPAPPAWRRIGGGEGGRTVLAVDYDATGRPEASFDQLAAHPALAGLSLWHAVQPETGPGATARAEDYLRAWQRPPATDGPVEAVLGYCVGGVFAGELADRLAEQQGFRPRVLLFDPEPVDDGSVLRDFLKTLDTMTILSTAERAEHRARAEAAHAAAGADFAAAAAGITAVYEAAAGEAFERLGLDEEESEDLLDLFRAYVRYLTAARDLSPEPGWATATALTSAGSSPGAPHAREELGFETTTAALLEDDGVARAVARLLAAPGPATPGPATPGSDDPGRPAPAADDPTTAAATPPSPAGERA